MFGINKIKARVRELEEKVWYLENPAKFKKGDQVRLCSRVDFISGDINSVSDKTMTVAEVKRYDGEYYKLYGWVYTLTNCTDVITNVYERQITSEQEAQKFLKENKK